MGRSVLSIEEKRQEMIASARDYLDAVQDLLEKSNTRVEDEIKLKITLNETKVTWLERLAAMMNVNAARRMNGDSVELVFADTDGDPVLDEDTNEPVVVFNSFDDISKMVISVPKEKAG